MNTILNIESILKTSIENDPWQYKVIDDILEENSFLKLKSTLEEISKIKKNDEIYSDGIWPNEFEILNSSNDIYQIVTQCQKEFLSIKNELLSQFNSYLESQIGYYGIPKLNYSIDNLESAIHDEGKTKTLALVIYMIPEETIGTKLYNSSKKESFVKSIDWKPNRGFLMCSQPEVTWHSYGNNGLPRYTLNLYYEKLEALSNIQANFDEDRYVWFLNNMHELDLISYK